MPKLLVSILGWESEGLRCPDVKLRFLQSASKPVYPISLIQMPNGTGKTTTLELLRAAMSGDAQNWNPDQIQQMQKKGGKSEAGHFALSLSVDGKQLTISMTFDFQEKSVSYATTLPSGKRGGFAPPQSIVRFMRPEFVRLIAFDGELAHDLLDSKKTNAQAAVEDLYQLQLMREMRENIKVVYDRKVEDVSAKGQKGLKQRMNRLNDLKKRIEDMKHARDAARKLTEAAEATLKAKEKKYQATIASQEKTRIARDAAAGHVAAAKSDLVGATSDLKRLVRILPALSPKFAREILDFRTNLDRVKLPESAAREFFEELAQEINCVCGRQIDAAAKTAIIEGAKRYMGTDDVALLNAIKSDISDHVKGESDLNIELGKARKKMKDCLQALHAAQTKLEAVESQAREGNPDLKNIFDEITQDRLTFVKLRDQLLRFEDKNDALPDDQTWGVDVLERRKDTAEKKLAEALQVQELKAKTDLLMKILEKAETSSRDELCETIARETNARISKLLPDNDIRVSSIRQSLVLSGQAGGSAGETLSVSYAFLSNLFDRSDVSLPFIVDSPANPIDLDVRREVGALVPLLARQFIAFTISSEHPDFLEPLEKAAAKEDKNISYMTVFRKSAKKMERYLVQAKALKDSVETTDAMVVFNRDFYKGFQIESEE